MSILVNRDTRVICQGFTGSQGTLHSEQAIAYGTQLVGGVTPGKGGTTHLDRPVFDTVGRSRRTNRRHGDGHLRAGALPARTRSWRQWTLASISSSASPRAFPPSTCSSSRNASTATGGRLIGPNCPGVITPGECKIGIMPGDIHLPGKVGVVSRSGTLTYEAVKQTTDKGYGQSSCVGIGGDPIPGTHFKRHPGPSSRTIRPPKPSSWSAKSAAPPKRKPPSFIAANVTKPVVGYIAGVTAPPGKRMGHAGAIIAGGKGTADEKFTALQACGRKDGQELGRNRRRPRRRYGVGLTCLPSCDGDCGWATDDHGIGWQGIGTSINLVWSVKL